MIIAKRSAFTLTGLTITGTSSERVRMNLNTSYTVDMQSR